MPYSAATYSAAYLDPPSGTLRTLRGKNREWVSQTASAVHALADKINRQGYSAATAQATVPAWQTRAVTRASQRAADASVLSNFLLIDS